MDMLDNPNSLLCTQTCSDAARHGRNVLVD